VVQLAGRVFVTATVQAMRSRVEGIVRSIGLQSIPPLQHWSVDAVANTRGIVSLTSAYSRSAQQGLLLYLLKTKTM